VPESVRYLRASGANGAAFACAANDGDATERLDGFSYGDGSTAAWAQRTHMRPYRDLRVLDAAEDMVTEVIAVMDANPRRLLFKGQIEGCAQGVPANIGEAFGRTTIPDRNRVLGIARGEAEEVIRHLRTNYSARRLDVKVYWRLKSRLVTIIKMLNALMS
jgi:four helix bundle protein